MRSDWSVYYGSPAEFDPVNAAYLQLAEQLQEQQVDEACDYIMRTYGWELTKMQMEEVFEIYDIQYPLLPKWMQDKFDKFDIIG